MRIIGNIGLDCDALVYYIGINDSIFMGVSSSTVDKPHTGQMQ